MPVHAVLVSLPPESGSRWMTIPSPPPIVASPPPPPPSFPVWKPDGPCELPQAERSKQPTRQTRHPSRPVPSMPHSYRITVHAQHHRRVADAMTRPLPCPTPRVI